MATCSFIMNWGSNKPIIDRKMQISMWYSGLRGTITYLLALQYMQDFRKGNGDAITALTLTFSLFTVFLLYVQAPV